MGRFLKMKQKKDKTFTFRRAHFVVKKKKENFGRLRYGAVGRLEGAGKGPRDGEEE